MPDLAGALTAHHARADRRVGQALAAEERAVGGRFDAGHDVAADALLNERRRSLIPKSMEIDIELPPCIDMRPFVT